MRDARWIELFERYRTRGDVQALAELFDELAPTLLKVARHLDGRRSEAEDLVQTTFLVAIERAATYDATRPLVPWMMGILVNQARIARRKRRESSDDGGSERLVSPAQGEDAESREIQAAVAKALEALPETYREVVIAHLQRGQKPGEIARELGRPQGTVRAQLHRGLRLVRRMLPAGLSIGVLAVGAPRSLAAVRRTVLLDASRRAGPGHSLPRSQPLLAVKLAAAALFLVALGLWIWNLSATPLRAEPAEIAQARTTRPGAIHAANEPALERETNLDTRVVVLPDAGPAAEPSKFGRVEVRVARRDTQVPVDGVLVSLVAWGDERWFDHIVEKRSDRDGMAVFDHVHPGRVGIHAEHGDQERIDVFAAHTTQVGLIWHVSNELRGRVVDARGYAVGNATVELWHSDGTPSVRTAVAAGSDGRFELPAVDAMHAVGARAPNHAPSTLAWLGSPAHPEHPKELVLVLRDAAPPVTGRVHELDGKPIAGARVVARSPSSGVILWRDDGEAVLEVPPRTVASDEAGFFDLGALPPGAFELEIEAAGFARWTTSARGEHSLELDVALARGGRVHGTFVTRDGLPLEGAEVCADGRFETRSDEAGRFVITLPAGVHDLRARDGRYGAWRSTRIVLAEGEDASWECALEPPQVIRGHAITADGQPLLRGLVCSIAEDAHARDAGDEVWGPWSRPGGLPDEVVHSWTSVDGSFSVPCRGNGPQTIEVRRRAHWLGAAAGRMLHVQPGSVGLRIAVGARDAYIRGKLVDERGEPLHEAEIVAFPVGGGGEVHARVDAEHGTFELGPLLSDEQRLIALVPSRSPAEIARVFSRAATRMDVGALTLPALSSIELVGDGPFVLRGADGLHRPTARTHGGHWVSGPIPRGRYRVWRGALDLDVEIEAKDPSGASATIAR